MLDVQLALEAEKDLESVFDYTFAEFGIEQAEKYTLEFQDSFDLLAEHPFSGRERNEIREGLRSLPKDAHVIFYRVFKNHIRIVRVLHGSRDIHRFL